MSAKSFASTSSGSSEGTIFGLFSKGKSVPNQQTVVISLNGSTLGELPQSHPRPVERESRPVTMQQQRHNMLSEFFGGHPEQMNETSSLPSYTSRVADPEAPPEYEEEFPTLARDLFKCGFRKSPFPLNTIQLLISLILQFSHSYG